MPIENRDELATTPARETALACVTAGIEAALPERVVADGVAVTDTVLTVDDTRYDLGSFSAIQLVGAGKGAGRLAAALVDALDGRVDGGVVISDEPADAGPVEVVVGDHPIPTERNVAAAPRIRDSVADAPVDALVLVALTGGASALLTLPGGDLTVDDIAGVLQASIARPNPGAIYNVADDEPAAPADVTAYACELLGVDPPPLVSFADAGMSEMAKTFWRDNKRVDNARIHRELGVRLAYPTFREGLRAVLDAEAER